MKDESSRSGGSSSLGSALVPSTPGQSFSPRRVTSTLQRASIHSKLLPFADPQSRRRRSLPSPRSRRSSWHIIDRSHLLYRQGLLSPFFLRLLASPYPFSSAVASGVKPL